jgi:serine/threonine-protein kinase
VGQVIAGKYRIERQIGRGGMGIVLAATHLQLEHLVAIKVMRRDLIEDDKALDRLLFEARSAARIRSEHVARVLDVGTLESGSPFIVMEYLEGEDLADLLDREGMLAVEQAVLFMLQCCEALAEVHVSEMVHRDLKPGNLFIARLPDGSPTLKIVDFGISKHIGGPAPSGAATTSSHVLGSPFYMAPEQMRAEPVDERSDIWALGAILFEMLTGRTPFTGETVPAVYASVLSNSPPSLDTLRPGIPPGLDDVVQRCLEKDPAQRFCDVADLAEALAPFGGPASAQRVERITRILTNPGPLRSRSSLFPASTSGSLPVAVAGGPLGEIPPSSPSARAWAEVTPASGMRGNDELRPRGSRTAAIAVGLGCATLAMAVWLRGMEPAPAVRPAPAAVSLALPGPAPASAEPSEDTLARVAARSGSTRPSDVEQAGDNAAQGLSEPSVGSVKRALRPAARQRPSISVEGFRAAVVAKKRKPNEPVQGPKPHRTGSAAARAAFKADETETKAVEHKTEPAATAAAPASATDAPRGEDPWNPSSFGDRR